MQGWLWIIVPIAIGVLSALGSPDEKGREGGIQFMLVVLFWRAMYLIAYRTDFGRSVWAWAVWLAKLYFFWMSGFFILYYIYRAFANIAANTAKEAEKWDRTVRTEANGRTVITMVNRETGQWLEKVFDSDVLVHVESCTSRGCWPERPTRGRRGHEGRF